MSFERVSLEFFNKNLEDWPCGPLFRQLDEEPSASFSTAELVEMYRCSALISLEAGSLLKESCRGKDQKQKREER